MLDVMHHRRLPAPPISPAPDTLIAIPPKDLRPLPLPAISCVIKWLHRTAPFSRLLVWSREAAVNRHTSTALPMAAAFASAAALGIYAPPRLDCHTRTHAGSFQQDSAGAGHSCRRFRLHDRRASCPFSGAVRRCRLPGIVSFHSHCRMEGATLRPVYRVVFSRAAYGLPAAATAGRNMERRARYSIPPRCRAAEKGGAGMYTPTASYYHALGTRCPKDRAR